MERTAQLQTLGGTAVETTIGPDTRPPFAGYAPLILILTCCVLIFAALPVKKGTGHRRRAEGARK